MNTGSYHRPEVDIYKYNQVERSDKSNPGDNKKIYPTDEVSLLVHPETGVLLEIRSKSGTLLYSRAFTYDEALAALYTRESFPDW